MFIVSTRELADLREYADLKEGLYSIVDITKFDGTRKYAEFKTIDDLLDISDEDTSIVLQH